MPIYEYRCTACGHLIEVIQKHGDKPLTKCTECSGKLEKLISRTAFRLKGGGWYAEGYGKGSGASAKPGASGDAKSGSEGGTKKAAAGGCGSGACGCH